MSEDKFEQSIEDLDKPDPLAFEPRTPMAIKLAQAHFFNRAFIRWKFFHTKKERDRWEQAEKDFSDAAIEKQIEFFRMHVAPAYVVDRILKALYNNFKPDRTATWSDVKEIE